MANSAIVKSGKTVDKKTLKQVILILVDSTPTLISEMQGRCLQQDIAIWELTTCVLELIQENKVKVNSDWTISLIGK